jgi:hypothetical protein
VKLEISKVHDAYAAGGECPLCSLMDQAERSYLSSLGGARAMEPSVRVRTNQAGFCPRHYERLYKGENKLGLALMVHTHLAESLPRLKKILEGARQDRQKGPGPREELSAFREGCYLCGLLDTDLSRYAFTVIYLWKKDPEFAPVYRASRGFCLGHFPAVLDAARANLRGPELERWAGETAGLMSASLERLEREVLGFTQLHQASVKSLGTEEERTALARALQVLAGRIMSRD